MAWEQLSVNKPHLVYILLGAFTSIFMLCSSIIKERLYIGEATVATLFGVIFGPHAANLIDPGTWGNVDQITLEFSRIVLVVQCFAVGVELPKYYMEKHWRSVVFLLVPVMTFGWLMTSLFIWAMFHDRLNWLDSLVISACVTATDPVLASSVVGKGKFAQRVPRHLRDLLSAESGCNDGMAFPFVYLGVYLVRYHLDAAHVTQHWMCNTVLYECIAGATYGVLVGYIARRAIRYAHEKSLIDRESFLVFYFVLALFCAGSGSLLGMDDLLVGFACGVGFSNDGWFLEKTEESHVSNVIDLLINLAFFVYFGTIIPWGTYNSDIIGTTPWKMVIIALLVLFFRRLPIMLALKPVIPDIKTWREALFAGHFGPIGVGAIFVAILARAELETETTTPLAELPEPGFEHLNIIELIWPITTFLVITSILVHGSSIAVFTLGKHINTLTLTMSFTKEKGDDGGNWMDRLPRIQSRSRSQMSSRPLSTTSSEDLEEKLPDYPAATLPKDFLRRQKESETPPAKRHFGVRNRHRAKRGAWDPEEGPGGKIEQSAIAPVRRTRTASPASPVSSQEIGSSETEVPTPNNEEEQAKHDKARQKGEPEQEVYEEGNDTIIEDEEGNVLKVLENTGDMPEREREQYIRSEMGNLMISEDVQHGASQRQDHDPASELKKTASQMADQAMGAMGIGAKPEGDKADPGNTAQPPQKPAVNRMLSRLGGKDAPWHYSKREKAAPKPADRKSGPARAFKFGNTIIVEDEDGEVIKKYELPTQGDRKHSYVDPEKTRQRLQKMGKWIGMSEREQQEAREAGPSTSERPGVARKQSTMPEHDKDDDDVRFVIEGEKRRMSKADFFQRLQTMDPKKRQEFVEQSDAPEGLKEVARDDAAEHVQNKRHASMQEGTKSQPRTQEVTGQVQLERMQSSTDRPQGDEGVLRDEHEQDIPVHNFKDDLARTNVGNLTAAERRRRAASQAIPEVPSDSDDDGTERIPPAARRGRALSPRPPVASESKSPRNGKNRAEPLVYEDPEQETAAERRRREAALSHDAEGPDSEEDDSPRRPPQHTDTGDSSSSADRPTSIRFAGEPTRDSPKKGGMFGSVRWGGEKGR